MKLGNHELVFSKIVLKNRLATSQQLEDCVRTFQDFASRGEKKELGEILVEKGYLTERQLAKAKKATRRTLELVDDILYGKIVIKNSFASEEKVKECFAVQKASGYKIRLWELLLLKDYITEDQHYKVLEEQKEQKEKAKKELSESLEEEDPSSDSEDSSPPPSKKSFSNLKFGEVALQRLLVTSEQVEECLKMQKEMRKRGIQKKLGEVMMEKNYINEIQVSKIIGAMEGREDSTSLIESYIIEEKVGEGAMGVVYKAYLEGTTDPIALKVLRPYIAESRETLKRFVEEAKKAITLNHPNIVRAYEVGVSEEYYYYTMEFVEGLSVKDILAQEERILPTRAVDIICDVAKALHYASHRNIIHRDIKPDNILIPPQGVAKLCDLGIAKDLHRESDLTQAGMVVGTPYYISPELAKGQKDVDHRSDLYSLGATFYKMVTGRVPFEGESATSVLVRHLTAKPLPPSEIFSDIPPVLDEIILRLMAKKPDDRFQSAADLIDSLGQL